MYSTWRRDGEDQGRGSSQCTVPGGGMERTGAGGGAEVRGVYGSMGGGTNNQKKIFMG